jgi:hypothetical protein
MERSGTIIRIIVSIIRIIVLAEQDCSPCKYVLCTAFRCTPILCVKTSLWIIGGAAIAVECAQTVTIIAIMSILLQLLFQLYELLFHNQKSHLGLEFIADYRPIASSVTEEQCSQHPETA